MQDRKTFAISYSNASEFEATFIDVGQGNCTLINCPNGNPLLVDGGSSAQACIHRICRNKNDTINIISDKLKKYLKNNPKKLINIIITQPDKDHFNYIPNIVKKIDKNIQLKIMLGGSKSKHEKEYVNKSASAKKYLKDFYTLLYGNDTRVVHSC